jgi:hypothetical protein
MKEQEFDLETFNTKIESIMDEMRKENLKLLQKRKNTCIYKKENDPHDPEKFYLVEFDVEVGVPKDFLYSSMLQSDFQAKDRGDATSKTIDSEERLIDCKRIINFKN